MFDPEQKVPITPFWGNEEKYFDSFKRDIGWQANMSLFMDHFIQKIKKIPDARLDPDDIELKTHCIELCKFLGRLKVVDAKVLVQLWDIYKFKPFE